MGTPQFQLQDLFPWGRKLDEYRNIFRLTPSDLRKRILGCADGPASFNAELTTTGGAIVSCDPLYQFSVDEISTRAHAVNRFIIEKMHEHRRDYHWQYFSDPDALSAARLEALSLFLADFERGKSQGRYVSYALPKLPFESLEFDLALCSFLFFLRPEMHSVPFHMAGLRELSRVARETRIYPVLQLDGQVPAYAEEVYNTLRADGFEVSLIKVPPILHCGADQFLSIKAK